jgi:transposase
VSTKIHALVEGLGNPVRWCLTAGQVHDVTQVPPLLEGIEAQAVVADKAFDSDELIEAIENRGAEAVIPPRANRQKPRSFDTHVYKDRNLSERFFNRLKQFRRIATRYDKLVRSYSAFIAVVCAWIM